MTAKNDKHIDQFIGLLYGDTPQKAVDLLKILAEGEVDRRYLGMLRLAALRADQNLLYYQGLFNLWKNKQFPPLKPNPTHCQLYLLADSTAEGLIPFITMFGGCFGLECNIQASAFDSVEQFVFCNDQSSDIAESDTIVLFLSEHWLKRYLGHSWLIQNAALEKIEHLLEEMIDTLLARSQAQLLVVNFPPLAFPSPSAGVKTGTAQGWNIALNHLNQRLWSLERERLKIVDGAEVLFGAGGRLSLGRLSYLRARMVLESRGVVTVAREIATSLANLFGKTHRALVTDWDNTLWGGVAGEGEQFAEVKTGPESPDGLGYFMVQEYLRGLKAIGALLAVATKNDPQVVDIFQVRKMDLALGLDDFASIQANWNPKSESIRQISSELGFGTEFMVFLDDNLFELAEVFRIHPDIDLLPAGPDPETTLRVLSESRFFNCVSLSETDMKRSENARVLQQQRELRQAFGSTEEFLRNIDIRLYVGLLDSGNAERVQQMFQKTNQFNLTTRRHTAADLKGMLARGAIIPVFSYEDSFGSQGIIATAVLIPDQDRINIESWLMSCRVLNRQVESAVFDWVLQRFPGKTIQGEFIPTEKNSLVADLYKKMGFDLIARDNQTGAETWCFTRKQDISEAPSHCVKILES